MSKPIRPIRIEGKVAYVPLTQGYEAIIDADDVPVVDRWNWRATSGTHTTYAGRSERYGGKGKQKGFQMHRILIRAPQGFHVDHKNGNGLDNRKANLRLVTVSQNARNARPQVNKTSIYKGVHWSKAKAKWRSMINLNGKRHYLGYFTAPEEAHAAYCQASARLHGEFGRVV